MKNRCAPKVLFVVILALLTIMPISRTARATSTGNSWFMVFSNLGLWPQWSLSSDAQLRQAAAIDETRQYQLRTTAIYELHEGLKIGGGYLYGETTDYDPANEKASVEHRVHQQAEYKADRLTHRVRLEQRFIGTEYSNRVRYRALGRWPAEGPYGTVYNEAFFDFAQNQKLAFDQNRLYGAAGIPFSKESGLRAELGYMWQAVARNERDPLHVHALQVSLFSDL